jgi:predicted permease
VKINGVPFTIVGVADPKFLSLSFGNIYDLWIPMNFAPVIDPRFMRRHNDTTAWWVTMAGRLKPGVPAPQAQAAIDLLFRNYVLHGGDKPMSKEADSPGIKLVPANAALVGHSGQFADPLRAMMVVVGIVLLIACANVAGLVLARATARRREIAVRLALGARRGRLVRQLLTESVLLAIMGGALGVLIALWSAHAIVTMISSTETRPIGLTADLDLRVLAFTAVVSLLTGILFGLVPALRSLHLDLTPTLKEGSQASSGAQHGRQRWLSLGNALVVFQAALAIVVLMGAGLLVHTLTNLKNLNPGFDTRNILTFGLNPALSGYKPQQMDGLYRRLQEEISPMPGVLAVSYSESALLSGSWSRTTFRYIPPNGSKLVEVEADYMPISTGFFSTMKIPVLSGRLFNAADFEAAAAQSAANRAQRDAKPGTPPPPAPATPTPTLVNQTFAKKYFPGRNPLGQRVGAEDGSDPDRPKNAGYEIIGVVEDVKYDSLRREIDPTMYVPITSQNAVFEVRTVGDPNGMIAPIRNLINQRDSNLPMDEVRTQSEKIDMMLARERIIAQLASFFGLLALVLACVGLYGLLSYEVSRRTREIGIRMALGAQRLDLIRLVVWQGVALAVIGAVVGIGAAFGVARLLKSLLYGVKPADPVTLVSVAALLVVTALAAAFVPARRATRVDPMVALRYE